jgi:NADPH:quinone reductase-like Zn-dependent oxidoreductase
MSVRAARVHEFGPPDVIVVEDVSRPTPGPGELLVRVEAAGVGPWDAWIREHKSQVKVSLPLTLGSDISGVVEEMGSEVSGFSAGDAVYGVTNPQFVGAYAEYAVASAGMMAMKPGGLGDVETASAPVVATTAWQMLFDYAEAKAGQIVLIHGAAGNVGAYAVQLASQYGLQVIATASAEDAEFVKGLGAARVVNYNAERFEDAARQVDIVLDTVGGETRDRSINVLKHGGVLVSAVAPIPESLKRPDIRTVFFLVEVTTARLNALTDLFKRGKLKTQVGTVLSLDEVRTAHKMLAGAPHKRGKIVLGIRD